MAFLEAIRYLLDPWVFLAYSASYIPTTIVGLIRQRKWSTLFRWRSFKSAWFANFWGSVGPQLAANAGPKVVLPLLRGRIRHGRMLDDSEKKEGLPPMTGTVIEVGPGSGNWVSVFGEINGTVKSSLSSSSASASPKSSSRRRKSSVTSTSSANVITKVFGVEPNTSVHKQLQEKANAAGLQGVYEIVPTGIEDLAITGKVAKGSVDCVVSVLCLCGIPEPQKNIRELYGYLKPGGRMYVYEHVCCSRHWAIARYQRLVNIFWPTFLGGCQLLRDTGAYLREAGPWTSVDLAQPVQEPWYQVVPHIVGVLVK